MYWLQMALLVVFSYLLGAVPTGLIVGSLVGKNPLEHGSGKIGTANTLNSAGPVAAAAVLVLDFVKGALVVWVARLLTWPSDAWEAAALGVSAAAAIVGHNWSIWVRLLAGRWGGGRGIVTALGAMTMVNPVVALVAVVVGGLVMLATRYMALGAILGALAGVAAVIVLGAAGQISPWLLPGAVAWGLLVVLGFHDNISRLISGKETKI
jgi:acyl phosphate:glycerol-3-phosphate acyltransferase